MKRYVLVLIFTTAAAFSVFAADTLELDMEAAVSRALEHNRALQISLLDLQAKARSAETAWNQLLPGVSAAAGLTHVDRLFSDPVMPGQEGWTASGSIDASVALRPGVAFSIRQTRLEYAAEEISWEQAQRQLVAQVEKEFLYLVAARSEIRIQEANLALARERYGQTRIDFEAGRTSELSMLQAQVNAANQEPAYLTTVNAYSQRLQTFLILLGLDPDTDVQLEGDLSVEKVELDAPALIERYVPGRADVQGQVASIQQLKNQSRLTTANGRSPTLTLSAGWSSSVATPFEPVSWEQDRWTDNATIGVRLSMPLDGFVPGSTTAVAVADGQDRITQGEIRLLETTAAARTEVINLVRQLETAWANIESARLTIELARNAYEMSEQAFRRGTMQLLDVEDSQQEYLIARQSYNTYQYQYRAGLIDLRLALGVDELPKGVTDE